MKRDPEWLVRLCPIKHRPGTPDPNPDERERFALWVSDETARDLAALQRERPKKRPRRPAVNRRW